MTTGSAIAKISGHAAQAGAIACALLWATPGAAAEPPGHLAAQAFLAGHCWRGTFPNGKATDEHCFEWVYDGQFLRDRHVVEGNRAPYGGETLYYWDSTSSAVHYLYINTSGGHSRGTVAVADGVLMFPEERYTANGVEQVFRSQWRRDGADAYLVLTERMDQGQWREAWRMRMTRSAAK